VNSNCDFSLLGKSLTNSLRSSSISYFTVTFIVAPFAMVGGASISATQVYKAQNVIAWGAYSPPSLPVDHLELKICCLLVLMTLGPGLLLIVRADSSKATWEAL